MAKQQSPQKYIYKITSSRMKKARWNLVLSIQEARKNEEIVSLNDSQVLDWIDEFNGVTDRPEEVRSIRRQIREIKRQPDSAQNRRAIRRLYEQLDSAQFVSDFLYLVIDHNKDLYRACKGFKVNGKRFFRLLGTNGGVKDSTIIFVSESVIDMLREKIHNGHSEQTKLIPAKYEAYRALSCSGSSPVSMPNGILVVKDCVTKFRENVLFLDDEGVCEPKATERADEEIELDESDGYGLMLPSLAERWSTELGLRYTCCGFNTRLSFEKGMVFTFDFIEFADKIAGRHIVKDAWGNDVDVTKVELVLTTSMLKLWDSYASIDDYLANCEKNGYSFRIAKTAPAALDDVRNTNYQFLNPYHLSYEEIEKLIEPTKEEMYDVLSGDYRRALVFLRGMHVDEDNAEESTSWLPNALMADKRMFDDPFVRKRIYSLIEKRIGEAKIGVISVHGNYSIVCGDPYALCQSIFGMPVTGLLKAGEIYNQYWADEDAHDVACFRAPMSCMNNILGMRVADRPDIRHWYQYIKTCTLFNAWDGSANRLNGMD